MNRLKFTGVLVTLLAGASPLVAQDWVELELETPFAHAYFVPNPDTSEFHAQVVLPYGEAHMDGPEGMAHYLEHLVANSAFPNNMKVRFQNDFNATTTNTFTNYYMNSAESQHVLDYLVGVFNPIELLPEFQFSERNVVEREYNFRYAESPEAQAWDKKQALLYKGSPMARSVIGTPESILSLDPEIAKSIHETHYVLEAASLVVSANLSADEVEALIDEAFADVKRGSVPQPTTVEKPVTHVGTEDMTLEKLTRDQTSFSALLDPEATANWRAVSNIASRFVASAEPKSLGRQLNFDENLTSYFECYTDYIAPIARIEASCYGQPKRNKPLPDLIERLESWRAGLDAEDADLQASIDLIRDTIVTDVNNLKPQDIYGNLLGMVQVNPAQIMSRSEYILALNAVTVEDILAFYDAILESETRMTFNELKGE